MAEPSEGVLPLLREMRTENLTNFAEINRRLRALEEGQVTFRHAMAADTLYGKLVTGDFQERIEALEDRVKHSEGRL